MLPSALSIACGGPSEAKVTYVLGLSALLPRRCRVPAPRWGHRARRRGGATLAHQAQSRATRSGRSPPAWRPPGSGRATSMRSCSTKSRCPSWSGSSTRGSGAFRARSRPSCEACRRYLDGRVDLRRWLQKKTGVSGEILFSEHHLSHAAFAFHSSPFAAARVLVADGVGEWATTSLWTANDDGLVVEREIHFPDSLGLFYSIVTAHLGFRVNEDEYKVMGLAAYGKESLSREMDLLLPLLPDGAFRLNTELVDLAGRASPSHSRTGSVARAGARARRRHRREAQGRRTERASTPRASPRARSRRPSPPANRCVSRAASR